VALAVPDSPAGVHVPEPPTVTPSLAAADPLRTGRPLVVTWDAYEAVATPCRTTRPVVATDRPVAATAAPLRTTWPAETADRVRVAVAAPDCGGATILPVDTADVDQDAAPDPFRVVV